MEREVDRKKILERKGSISSFKISPRLNFTISLLFLVSFMVEGTFFIAKLR